MKAQPIDNIVTQTFRGWLITTYERAGKFRAEAVKESVKLETPFYFDFQRGAVVNLEQQILQSESSYAER